MASNLMARLMRRDYAAYDRASLNFVLADVKRHKPDVNPRDAGITKSSGRPALYCFQYREFFWYGNAENAIEARAAGWSAWLTKEGAEGYAQA